MNLNQIEFLHWKKNQFFEIKCQSEHSKVLRTFDLKSLIRDVQIFLIYSENINFSNFVLFFKYSNQQIKFASFKIFQNLS